jgi:hypothetical protein
MEFAQIRLLARATVLPFGGVMIARYESVLISLYSFSFFFSQNVGSTANVGEVVKWQLLRFLGIFLSFFSMK